MFSVHGKGLGGGIAIGRARVLRADYSSVPLHDIAPEDRDAEVERLHLAITRAKAELQSLADHLPDDAPTETRALIEVHRHMLDDPAFGFAAQEKIYDEGINATWAWSQQIEAMATQLADMEDEYLRERARDVEQIGRRVIRQLESTATTDESDSGENEIIVAHDLDPAELMKWRLSEGFAIDLGGINSHTAIVARSLLKPSVVGLGDATERVENGNLVVLDGALGALIIEPSAEVLAAYRQKQQEQIAATQRRLRLVNVPCLLNSGEAIGLLANIELPPEAVFAVEQGAQGVGLFRSEFLFLDREQLPNEEEQFQAYKLALENMRGRPVTIRTIDVGADKALPQQQAAAPANPALGERAIRFSLRHPDIFMTQLRALLRATAHGPLSILIPMLAHRFEVEATKALVNQAAEQLQKEGLSIGAVRLGAMIEVPAAAIDADWFAQQFDFLSIGTNDLVQYTLAVDRTDHLVAQLYDSRHPAVLSLIRNTIEAGARHGKPVTVCGEMAGQPEDAVLLVQMGIRQLSMQPQALLTVKERLLELELVSAKTGVGS